MRTNPALVLAALTIACGLFVETAFAAEKPGTPEATAASFYTWFIKLDAEGRGYPVMDKEIYRYVSKPTVDLLRTQYKHNSLPGDAEYFTNVQDFDESDWEAHIAVHPAIMLDGVALVPVTLGSTDKKTNVAAGPPRRPRRSTVRCAQLARISFESASPFSNSVTLCRVVSQMVDTASRVRNAWCPVTITFGNVTSR